MKTTQEFAAMLVDRMGRDSIPYIRLMLKFSHARKNSERPGLSRRRQRYWQNQKYHLCRRCNRILARYPQPK